MLVYESTKSGFLDDVVEGQLVPEIKQGYESQGIGMGGPGEVKAWKNSLQYMHTVLSGSAVPSDAGVAIEFKIPLTSRRIDFLVSGYDETDTANVVIIELKQWDGDSTEAVEDKDGIVKTALGGGLRDEADAISADLTKSISYFEANQVQRAEARLTDLKDILQDADLMVDL